MRLDFAERRLAGLALPAGEAEPETLKLGLGCVALCPGG